MKKLTFALNYRKPKANYKTSEEIEICIRYYYKDSQTGKPKVKNITTGVKCKLSD